MATKRGCYKKHAGSTEPFAGIHKFITVVIKEQLICISSSDGVSLMYQRVQRVECSSPRPVLVLGPLVEACKDMLVKETPAEFCRCLPGELVHTDCVYF